MRMRISALKNPHLRMRMRNSALMCGFDADLCIVMHNFARLRIFLHVSIKLGSTNADIDVDFCIVLRI